MRRRQTPGLGNDARAFVETLSAGTSKVLGATFAALAEEFDAFPKLPKEK